MLFGKCFKNSYLTILTITQYTENDKNLEVLKALEQG